MKRIWSVDPILRDLFRQHVLPLYTHATSIAPTGTIALTIKQQRSNGINLLSSTHKYTRNVIKEGKKSKVAVDVYSYEMLLYKGTSLAVTTFRLPSQLPTTCQPYLT